MLALLLVGCDVPLDAVCFAERCAGRCVNDCGEYDTACCAICEVGTQCEDPTTFCERGPDLDDPRTCETIYGRTFQLEWMRFLVRAFDDFECWDPDEEGCLAGSSGGASLPDPYATLVIDDIAVASTEPAPNATNASPSVLERPEIVLAADTRVTLRVHDEDGDVDALMLECAADAVGDPYDAEVLLSCERDVGEAITAVLVLVR